MFVLSQNEVLLTILNVRNERTNSLETLCKDIGLILRIPTITEAPKEDLTKYKIVSKELSLLNELKESDIKIDEKEQSKFI